MPQNPHYKPLDNYCASVGDGIKVGLDVVFIDLAQKLRSSVELSSDDVEEYIAQLSELEEMGYDCTRLWERFDSLRGFSAQEQAASLKLEEITSTRRDKEMKATLTHTRITELEAELKRLEDASKTQQEEIETLNVNYTRQEKEKILQDFRSAATAPWCCKSDRGGPFKHEHNAILYYCGSFSYTFLILLNPPPCYAAVQRAT
ncbi:hypothetical protein MKW94_020282, partial [Papaver nudicaule]|nr:hypothetical protein [Papaver nudicaule]